MTPINFPGRRKEEEALAVARAAPMTRLEERREVLRDRFAELQWDLGGAAYEMAARDYFRLDVLATLAADLQVVDAELAEIERMARLESAGAAGACSGCGSLFARGAVYCWRCGRNLDESIGTVVGPSAAGQIVIDQPPARPAASTPPAPTRPVPPAATRAPAPAPPAPSPAASTPVSPVPVAQPGRGPVTNGNGHAPAPSTHPPIQGSAQPVAARPAPARNLTQPVAPRAHPLAAPDPKPDPAPRPETPDPIPEPVPEMRA